MPIQTHNSIRSVSMIALLIVAISASFAVRAGPGVWTSSGPEGGQVIDLETSAAAPAVVYASSSSALFKSVDSGTSWSQLASMQNLGFIQKVVASQSDASVVYLLTSTVLKSVDGGASFAPVTGAGLPAEYFVADLVLSPVEDNTLYLTTRTTGAFTSIDGGANWTAMGAATLPDTLAGLAIDPTDSDRLVVTPCEAFDGTPYAGAPVYQSTDGGVSFSTSTVTSGAPANFAACASTVAFSPDVPGLVLLQGNDFVGSSDYLLRSVDGGATFAASTGNVYDGQLANFTFVPGSPTQIVAGGKSGGSWISNNSGITFDAGVGPSWPGGVMLESAELLIKPGDATTRYVGTPGAGVYLSIDGGASYVESNIGFRSTNLRTLALNPSSPDILYAGQSDLNGSTWPFFRSADGAASWSATGLGSSLDWIRGLLVDANTSASAASTVIYAVGRDSTLAVPAPTSGSPVAKSMDGGDSFVSLNNFIGLGGPGAPLRSLGTSRAIVADESVVTGGVWSTLYLTATGRVFCSDIGVTPTVAVPRIWRSLDAGSSWNTIATPGSSMTPGADGLPAGECVNGGTAAQPFPLAFYPIPVPIVVDPSSPSTLYVGTFIPINNETLAGADPQSGVFKSTDGGATWTQASNGLPRYLGATNAVHTVLSLAMDPNNSSILYASANPLLDDGSLPGNVYKTVDAGANWIQVGPGLAGQDIRSITIDPSNSLRVLVASGGNSLNPGGVYISEDGGASWDSVSAGLPENSSTALVIDASDPAAPVFHSGTRNGMFSFTRVPDGDGDGAPSTVEGGAPNGGDGNGDGQLDALQSNVASAGDTQALLRQPRPFTISVEGISGACDQLYDVTAVERNAFGSDLPKEKPDGAFRFEIANCASARVTLRIAGAGFDTRTQMRIYGPRVSDDASSIGWNDLPVTIVGDRVSFVINDNSAGDARSDTNRILVQGGPAFEEALFSNGFE